MVSVVCSLWSVVGGVRLGFMFAGWREERLIQFGLYLVCVVWDVGPETDGIRLVYCVLGLLWSVCGMLCMDGRRGSVTYGSPGGRPSPQG